MSLMDKKNQFLEMEQMNEVEPKEIQPSDMKEFQTLIKNLNAEQTVLNNRLIKTIDLIEKDSLEQQINKDHRLNRERERAIQEQRENKRREEQGVKRENPRSIQSDDKEIRRTERASSREVRKGFEGSRKYQEISHGNDESIKSDSSSSRENRQIELEGQSKTICNSNGNNIRSNIDNSRSISPNKPNKVRDWDMKR